MDNRKVQYQGAQFVMKLWRSYKIWDIGYISGKECLQVLEPSEVTGKIIFPGLSDYKYVCLLILINLSALCLCLIL